jgi:hypothetical protein
MLGLDGGDDSRVDGRKLGGRPPPALYWSRSVNGGHAVTPHRRLRSYTARAHGSAGGHGETPDFAESV